jgi:hypothetical protein
MGSVVPAVSEGADLGVELCPHTGQDAILRATGTAPQRGTRSMRSVVVPNSLYSGPRTDGFAKVTGYAGQEQWNARDR